MAKLYADEQFPRQVVEFLRVFGHDILTVQEAGKANLKVTDVEVLAFAIQEKRAVLTLNRYDIFENSPSTTRSLRYYYLAGRSGLGKSSDENRQGCRGDRFSARSTRSG